MKKDKRQTLGEEIANAVSHGVMAIFGVVAMILLIIKADSTLGVLAAILFGFGMINLYTMSTLYHALFHPVAKSVFRRFDHLSIYILIGGSFAPALLLLPELQQPVIGSLSLGLSIFIVQWILIIVGVVFKSIWVKKYVALHTIVFLILGWSALAFIKQLFAFDQAAFWLILAGGVAYSLGVIFFALSKVKYFHFIWHIFCGLGTILQFIAYYAFLY
ncbi:MAG: hemolysin III family protein [Acholeplasmataceae bacterium]